MELNKERMNYIGTLADRIMKEMVENGYTAFKAIGYVAWDDAFAKKLHKLLNEEIEREKLEQLEIFYLGWWFGHRSY